MDMKANAEGGKPPIDTAASEKERNILLTELTDKL